MENYKIIKRTFEAAKYPHGSEKNRKLNEEIETSEFAPDEKYIIVSPGYRLSFKTLEECYEFLNS